MKKWEQFTREQLEDLWYNSLTKKDFCLALGYKSGGHVLEIQAYYSLLDKDLGKNNPNQKQYMNSPRGQGKIEDLRNKKFGHWTVLDLDYDKTKQEQCHTWWICECDCSNHTRRSVNANNLKRGKTQSCGCQSISILTENMIGKKFGKLTVLEVNKDKQSRRGRILRCKCECGNYTDVVSVDLRRGGTTSCGCFRDEIKHNRLIDLTGQTFNYLQVIKLDQEKTLQKKEGYWYCKCLKCNSNVLKSVSASALKGSYVKSCGCLKSSFEEDIKKILQNNNIDFKREYAFDDLYGDKGKLRFDFAIFKNNQIKYLIEYQGEQHYYPVKHWGGEEAFLKRKKYDKIKKEYCNTHNIPLIILNKNTELNKENVIKEELLNE